MATESPDRRPIEEILAEESDAIEAAEADQSDAPLPPHVTVTRGHPRAEETYCCRCYGCDDHDHVCGLPAAEAERYRRAHDDAVREAVRQLHDEGKLYIDADGVPRLRY
jgi:hypothetical protein